MTKNPTVFKIAVITIIAALLLSAERILADPPEKPADITAVAEAVAESESYSEGSESYSEGSSSESVSYAEGGKGGLSYSASSQGQSQVAGSDVSVGIGGSSLSLGGNNSSFRYDYREAARTAAALTTAVCQDGTSLQGVKFGISTVNQSTFCMYTVAAQLSLGISASIVCEDGPDYPQCVEEKRALFIQGANLLTDAIRLAERKEHRGLLKRLAGKIW